MGRRRNRSVSKRPFPTSQSYSVRSYLAAIECIKEAVPDQPEHSSSESFAGY